MKISMFGYIVIVQYQHTNSLFAILWATLTILQDDQGDYSAPNTTLDTYSTDVWCVERQHVILT